MKKEIKIRFLNRQNYFLHPQLFSCGQLSPSASTFAFIIVIVICPTPIPAIVNGVEEKARLSVAEQAPVQRAQSTN
jgi:hypothetical protein